MAARSAAPAGCTASPARLLARELVAEARVRDAYVRELVDARRGEVAAGRISQADFDFAQVLAFGVTMCAGTLDELIDRNLSSPRDVRAKLRDALRISAYELLFLGKPEHVAVSQGVELARSVQPRAAGLANAVLRKMARDARAFPWGDARTDDAALARAGGVPLWLAQRLAGQYGREGAERLLAACLRPAPTYLVANPFAPAQSFAADLSSQQTAAFVPLGGSLLEVGAGRGTKTLLLQCRSLQELGRCSSIHTVDVHAYKQRLLAERMRELGIAGVCAHVGDGRQLGAIEGLPASFDAAFVDAPCSGTGTMRRHPEMRWRLGPADVEELAGLQFELLCAAAARVRRGGTLVYATCSLLAEENEHVVERFLASSAGEGYEPDSLRPEELLDGQDPAALTSAGHFASLPREGGPDGHFAARFTRVR